VFYSFAKLFGRAKPENTRDETVQVEEPGNKAAKSNGWYKKTD
jgi:hypothetical protein